MDGKKYIKKICFLFGSLFRLVFLFKYDEQHIFLSIQFNSFQFVNNNSIFYRHAFIDSSSIVSMLILISKYIILVQVCVYNKYDHS